MSFFSFQPEALDFFWGRAGFSQSILDAALHHIGEEGSEYAHAENSGDRKFCHRLTLRLLTALLVCALKPIYFGPVRGPCAGGTTAPPAVPGVPSSAFRFSVHTANARSLSSSACVQGWAA